MKFYNKTCISSAALEPVLAAAAQRTGARSTGVIVKATQRRHSWPGVAGMAHHAAFCYAWHLRRNGGKRMVSTDGGYFSITIPKPAENQDWLHIAQEIFKMAMHEWVHIHDYQLGLRHTPAFARKNASGRRPRHDSRPEELRAINCVDEHSPALLLKHQDIIIALACELETRAKS